MYTAHQTKSAAYAASTNRFWLAHTRSHGVCMHSKSVICMSGSQNGSKRPQQYIGSDGRRKSTIEEAFPPVTSAAVGDPTSQGRPPPWTIGWQTSERNLEWNDDVKLRLLTRVTAEKMGISEEALLQRLAALSQLLPNIFSKMAIMGPDNLAKVAADPSSVALKLVQLKGIFPDADTACMVANRMGLILQDDLADIAAAAGDRSGSDVGEMTHVK
ncbi:hypothetical protein ABBQ32_013592 [Trebouxia sp. C0010 RCD-2024]